MSIRKQYDTDLESLKNSLTEMGRSSADAVENALEALCVADADAAAAIVKGDARINNMERDIEHRCMTLLLRQQPVAGDLRRISTAMKVVTDIERIGDHAADIAEIIPHLVTVRKEGDAAVSQAIAMGKKAHQMILDALDALTAEDENAARRVIAADDEVDYDFNAIKHQLAQEIAEDPGKVDAALDGLAQAGIRNVLALRGDLPEGMSFPGEEHFRYAAELIAAIRSRGAFCVGAACYPEGHPESPDRDTDLDYLRRKQDAGADFLTTQMVFDNDILYRFLYRALARGIHIPVTAGIMPVVNARQIRRIVKLSNATLPQRFLAILDRFADDPASMEKAGIAYATDQIIDMVANGVNRIHLYTMNRPRVAAAIFANLGPILRHGC